MGVFQSGTDPADLPRVCVPNIPRHGDDEHSYGSLEWVFWIPYERVWRADFDAA